MKIKIDKTEIRSFMFFSFWTVTILVFAYYVQKHFPSVLDNLNEINLYDRLDKWLNK